MLNVKRFFLNNLQITMNLFLLIRRSKLEPYFHKDYHYYAVRSLKTKDIPIKMFFFIQNIMFIFDNFME